MQKSNWRSLSWAAIAALAVAGLGAEGSRAQESNEPLKLILNDWTGQLLSANIMGEALKRQGYKVEYIQADAMAQFQGLQTGDLHVAMEVWATTQRGVLEEAVATGQVENLGETAMEAKEEWWYPSYMEEKCPGLPNWEALKDPACVEAFSTPDTEPKGRYLGAPVTWGGFDDERVEALGLDFEVVHAGTDAALFAELESAYQRKAPIILWLYAPHWAPATYEGDWIQFPPYTEECYAEMRYDCAKPSGPIWKAAWVGVKENWPGAYEAIKKFSIQTEEMNQLIIKVDREKQSIEDVAAEWLDQNQERWQGWFE